MEDEIIQVRSISIPDHRIKMMKKNWMKIYTPIVEIGKLQIRMNLYTRSVEIRTTPMTTDPAILERSIQFVRAISLGFNVEDALMIMNDANVYIESFDIQDVKILKGDHLSRAIGRIIGIKGKILASIQEASRTKVIVVENTIHIIGAGDNCRLARDSICRLIMGSDPGKISTRMKNISAKLRNKCGSIIVTKRDDNEM
ncbi:Pre-rRNA-processing protein PNO1 [Astathelohania contejeani]|uniref:Pre-rRNA-processing protein PNO1 n=1 Tax=Astathelohania contejeani TaxID=164912 RepID=A0ABQ7HW99_9MICR|nr:Pre-rRNA-processing protein PNO1 [Thelohania contejeani]